MASTFAASAALARDTTFRDQVQVAIVNAARAIISEPKTLSETAHDKRHRLAVETILSPGSFVEQWAWALASVTSISTGVTDAALQTAVNAGWSAMAGVRIDD